MTNITTPIGRMVAGSLYKPNTTDYHGQPLVVKTGVNAGQPRQEFFFALAIAKHGERHWAETEWGQVIWAEGHGAFRNGEAQRPGFAWKIVDGDSQQPNKRGTIPANLPGYPGHWVLNFSSSFAPRIYNSDGSQQILEPDAVKCGYYIQVAGSVTGNDNQSNPGVYLNHNMVALAGYGEEIITGPDASQVGFGGALPPGASAAPVGGSFNPAPAPAGYAPPPAPAPAPAGYAPPPAPAPAPAGYAPRPAPAPAPAPHPAPHPGFTNPQ